MSELSLIRWKFSNQILFLFCYVSLYNRKCCLLTHGVISHTKIFTLFNLYRKKNLFCRKYQYLSISWFLFQSNRMKNERANVTWKISCHLEPFAPTLWAGFKHWEVHGLHWIDFVLSTYLLFYHWDLKAKWHTGVFFFFLNDTRLIS